MELRELHTSRKIHARYVKALAELSQELDETWKRVFPLDARRPQATCEAFFGAFAKFGAALYDAHAEELLNSNPAEEEYLRTLNSDLKTLVCDQIYPYRQKPVKTFQDAVDADRRAELPGEWTVRMGESWRLFEHPRHSANHGRVCREFIDVYGYMPELWGLLIDRIHTAVSRRTIHWLSAHAERAAEGGLAKPNQAGAAGVSGKSTSTGAGPAADSTDPAKPNGKGRKRGPKPDHKGAARVAEIVTHVAPDGNWRGKLDEVCEALDEATIPFPPKWRRDRQCRCWADCLERPIAIKAIEYRLKIAKQWKQTTPETLS